MWKRLAIGCSVLAALGVVAVVVLIAMFPKLFDWVREEVARELERKSVAAGWQAPASGATPEEIFPAQIDAYRLESAADGASVPELGIDARGAHATYASGAIRIEVYAFSVTKRQVDVLFERVKRANEDSEGGVGTRRWTMVDHGDGYTRCYVESPVLHQNHLWFTQDWLVVFRTQDSEDREDFVLSFFRTGVSSTEPEPAKRSD
jgi:hypothetical protein